MSTQVNPHITPSPEAAGSRRAKLDLARFSLDLGWARGVSDSARNEAYPSPPMSGSPSHPARHKNDFEDRGYGGFGGPLHSRQQIGVGSASQEVEREGMRENASNYGHNAQMVGGQYGMYQQGGSVQVDQTQYHYQTQPQSLNQQRSLPPYQFSNGIQPLNSFAAERVPNSAPLEPAPVPKAQRKTKGHVASACVPCKRAHLRCDAMRPCSRCVTGGKEDSCIDVQHKKRGRPRLRDDRENRFDSNLYTRGPELLRRPISMYPNDSNGLHSDPLMRSSYRVLKSQAGPSQPAPRFLDHASVSDANIYAAPAQRQMIPQDVPYAYLNMDFQIIKATQAFCDSVGFPSVVARKLQDIVVLNERDKIEHLKEVFEAQRKRREPQYLPSLYGKTGEDRVIQSVEFRVDDVRRIPMDGHGVVNFQGPNGELRPFEVKIGLAKRDSTFFISLKLAPPPPPPPQHQIAQQQYPISSFTRDQQYGFQQPFQPAYTSQQFQQYQYQPPMQVQPQTPQHAYDESRAPDHNLMYRPMMNTTTPVQQTVALTTSMLNSEVSAYTRPSSSASVVMRSENAYAQPQYASQAQLPRNEPVLHETQQARPQTAQSELQLPPIRNQGSPAMTNNYSMGAMSAPTSAFRDDRASRLDIGGLLEKPAPQRRTSRG